MLGLLPEDEDHFGPLVERIADGRKPTCNVTRPTGDVEPGLNKAFYGADCDRVLGNQARS